MRRSRHSPPPAPSVSGIRGGTSAHSSKASPTGRRERTVENVEPFVELRVGDRERDQGPDDVREETRAQEEQTALAGSPDRGVDERRRRLFRLPVLHELDGLHGTEAADVADRLVPLRHVVESRAKGVADPHRAGEKTVALDDLYGPDRRRACDRVASERAADRSRAEGVEAVSPASHGADRKAGTQRLRRDEDIGGHARVLDREHAAGPAHAGLNLVGDEEDAVATADRGDPFEESGRWDHKPASGLPRLDAPRRDVLGREIRLEDLVAAAPVPVRTDPLADGS